MKEKIKDGIIEESDFEEIYNNTYNKILKFVIIKCHNIDDVNDIIQETYIELLKIIKKKKIHERDNIEGYIYGISNNIIKRHYSRKKKDNVITSYAKEESIVAEDILDIEESFITKENVKKIWDYLKKKELNIIKIFYLYYVIGLQIKEIAKDLELTESNVKNKIYRTLKELKKYLGKEVK